MLSINVKQQLSDLRLEINVQIPPKGVTAIFGRSGAGKSSLINLVAGLSKPDSGGIYLNGQALFDSKQNINLPPEKRNVGYVFQEHRLFPHYSVEKNLKYGCKRANSAKFFQIVQLLGITHLLDRFPNSLSGGEKQRVAIGRALLSEPDILLMDEPLSALDLPRKKELLDYLSILARQVAIPILYVSHSLDEVVRLADYLLLLEQGKMVAFDRTEQVWRSDVFSSWQPEKQRVSLLELPIMAKNAHYQLVGLGLGEQCLWLNATQHYQTGEKLRVTLNSRDISLTLTKPEQTSIRNILYGKICKISAEIDRLDLAIQVGEYEIWASISQWAFDELGLAENQAIYLQIKAISL
ncbi:molybdenum ABC transporter ATP-binding protein [Bibersteinia trehalosi Y31]|uniref:Molybdenum ABC transporter ATP-binding protein n=1 Tax=Bibersteinia trehalosi Y31 TaxID=1261658 RepID=A0A179CZP8_BIBTR|nr:molybdenum ABC transporter ATP-binding protein ModC [Bibersteinia trehalosi]OAQ15292.1 molybdenum ABC transporter ATP-binding protein [Bibersteinia trehalosi Y31]